MVNDEANTQYICNISILPRNRPYVKSFRKKNRQTAIVYKLFASLRRNYKELQLFNFFFLSLTNEKTGV